jgi:hypothetical protein
MPVQRPFLLYLRSRFHITLALAAAGLVVLSVLFIRPVVLPVALVAILYVILTGAFFFTRRGAREVVAESEEDRLKAVRQKITRYASLRERISVLRLGDEQISRAVELFLQESGSYLDKCRELDSYSPLANERIERVLEICQVFLGERDESSTGKRYGLPGSGGEQAPAGTFAQDIMECASVVRQRITEDLLGVSGEERLSIMKELEEKK